MSFATTTQNDATVIRVPSRFDFRVVPDFTRSVDVATRAAAGEIIIDFAETSYLDSSALGMLLILRDRARAAGKSVVLARAGMAVKAVLGIANFQKSLACLAR